MKCLTTDEGYEFLENNFQIIDKKPCLKSEDDWIFSKETASHDSTELLEQIVGDSLNFQGFLVWITQWGYLPVSTDSASLELMIKSSGCDFDMQKLRPFYLISMNIRKSALQYG